MKELKKLELLVKQRDYEKYGGEHRLCNSAMFFLSYAPSCTGNIFLTIDSHSSATIEVSIYARHFAGQAWQSAARMGV